LLPGAVHPLPHTPTAMIFCLSLRPQQCIQPVFKWNLWHHKPK
jgi:hypothetical protein